MSKQKKETWFHINADGKVLGRLASQIATIVRGKHKRDFSPHLNEGDFVIVTNAEKVKTTSKDKVYYAYSGYFGGLKETPQDELKKTHPERLIEFAVKGMLPPNKLRARFLKKLKIYTGTDHPHKAQKPVDLELRHNA
ncbi:MAG: 50S ribosomal protein L13 [Deltaproteobacteria bacterium]|nr:50S ribosomal protein L13 [Deltaproteobacteria bacterium]